MDYNNRYNKKQRNYSYSSDRNRRNNNGNKSAQAGEAFVHAPYNFVPFSNTVLFPYDSAEELPCHDKYDEKLHTGEIRVSLRAETPVFVSDGNNSFIKNGNGQLTIPGSTVKGMLRENAQILGFGLVSPGEDFDDYQIYYRAVAYEDKHYRDVIGYEQYNIDGSRYSAAKKVKGGYIKLEGDNYYIYPVKGEVKSIKRDEIKKELGIDVYPPIARYEKLNSGEYLLCPGKAPKGSPVYLFPAPDWSVKPEKVSDVDKISFMKDYEARRTVLKNKDFWTLPKKGAFKPIFFTKFDRHIFMGMTKFIRIGYKHKISEGLPKYDIKKGVPIDYPHALFGFSRGKSSYKSRVSVGDFCAPSGITEGNPQSVTLAEPKPSWYKGYIEGGNNYNADAFRLRGYKQYWLKPEEPGAAAANGNANMGSVMRPAPKDTVFTGTIRYSNLNDKELGLLLWSIRLNPGCFQSVGKGKPLGFARMAVDNVGLCAFDPKAAYSSLDGSPYNDISADVQKYIDAYNEAALGDGAKVSDDPGIQDFFYIRSEIKSGSEVSYMTIGNKATSTINEFQKAKGILPTIRKMREKQD